MEIKEIEVKSVMTKSNLPVCDFSVNPYVGCTHACKYCYASFMKRFTNHPEPWGGVRRREDLAGNQSAREVRGQGGFHRLRHRHTRKDRTYWSELDSDMRHFCEARKEQLRQTRICC